MPNAENCATAVTKERGDHALGLRGKQQPDASIFRDADKLACSWRADQIARPNRGIRFIESGFATLSLPQARDELARFVNKTLEWCKSEANEEYSAVAEDWAATQRTTTTPDTLVVAERAARLGLDPFDPQELTPPVLSALESLRPHRQLADDLLEVASPNGIEGTVSSVLRALQEVMPRGAQGSARSFAGAGGAPFDAGYKSAREMRKNLGLGLGRLADMSQLPVRAKHLQDSLADPGLVGLLGWDGHDYVLGLPQRPLRSERFALARALFLAPERDAGFGGRLVTTALSWEQAASRAFAAELLLPADALRGRLANTVDYATISKVADEFEVSKMVVKHQIENHQLAALSDA